MKNEELRIKNGKKTWQRVFYYSFMAHLAVIFVLVFTPLLHPKPRVIEFQLIPPMEMIPLAPLAETAPAPEVIEEAPPKEESALPKELPTEQKEIVIPDKPKSEPKVEPKPKQKPKPQEKPKKKTPSAEELRRRLQNRLSAVDQQSFARTRATQTEGVMTTQYFPYQKYLVDLQNKITETWEIPNHLAREENLLVFVTFTISRSGAVEKVSLKTSSGKQLFDQSAVEAVQAAGPFSELPQDYKEASLEITIRFELE